MALHRTMKHARIILDILFVLGAFLLPWWMIVILLLGAVFYFENYFEVLFIAIIIDALSSVDLGRFFHIQFVITFFFCAALVAAHVLKERLVFYTHKE